LEASMQAAAIAADNHLRLGPVPYVAPSDTQSDTRTSTSLSWPAMVLAGRW
jgi:hypothetical protein